MDRSAKTVEALMNRLKPEAAYFSPMNGNRTGMMFFDLLNHHRSSRSSNRYS